MTLQGRQGSLKPHPRGWGSAPRRHARRDLCDPHTHTDIDLEAIRIYEGDELIVDGSDPTSYVVLKTAEDVAAFRARIAAGALESPRDNHARRNGARP